jgi:hypothetical protein
MLGRRCSRERSAARAGECESEWKVQFYLHHRDILQTARLPFSVARAHTRSSSYAVMTLNSFQLHLSRHSPGVATCFAVTPPPHCNMGVRAARQKSGDEAVGGSAIPTRNQPLHNNHGPCLMFRNHADVFPVFPARSVPSAFAIYFLDTGHRT